MHVESMKHANNCFNEGLATSVVLAIDIQGDIRILS